jgi:diguanylate cyclase (GGDEF)-like protein
MTTISRDYLTNYLALQKSVLGSLRLKDVLDAVVIEFVNFTAGGKVAVFLSDNDALALKLMAAKGYSQQTLDFIKVVPFSAESLLKYVVQQRSPLTANDANSAPELSASLMRREGSSVQIGLPLISSNLLVGAMLIDSNNNGLLEQAEFLQASAEIAAMAIANSILYGRSEYERERLNTLYKTSTALHTSALKTAEVLQIAADTALILANTPNCAILLFDEAADIFHLSAFKGLDGGTLDEFDLGNKDTMAGTTLRSGKTAYFHDGARDPFGLPQATGGVRFNSAVVVPLVAEGKKLGVLEVFSVDHRAFHKEQVALLESLAAQVSNALYIALTHETTVSQALQDAHTGLSTRAHFDSALNKEIERSSRHHHEFGLLFVDIDHLAQVNEVLGEERGDEAIRHVAFTLKDALRDIDLVCRYGGEQFAVLLPETPRASVLEVAERLRNNIRNKNVAGVGVVTVSVGAATFPHNAEQANILIESAEDALNVAKYQGRDRVVDAQSGRVSKIGPIAWAELSKEAKMAVVNERQSKLQSRLSAAPEYASWMTKNSGILKRRSPEQV